MLEIAVSREARALLPFRILELRDRDPSCGIRFRRGFDGTGRWLSYAAMPSLVAAYARHLRAHGIERGSRVVVPFETTEEIVLSFLALLVLGALPLSIKPLPRGPGRASHLAFLARLAERHGPLSLLEAPSFAGASTPLPHVPLLPFGPDLGEAPSEPVDVTPSDVAFVQYTSGSTSEPKGIPITHGALSGQLDLLVDGNPRRVGTRGSTWLPLFHDMGLVGGLLSCIHSGTTLDLASPQDFLMSPLGWLEHLSRDRIEMTVVPNFALEYCARMLRDVDAEDLRELRFDALRTIFLGSEPINIGVLEWFVKTLEPYGFDRAAIKPCYGMAEAVLMVTTVGAGEQYRLVDRTGVKNISVGKPARIFDFRIRDEQGRLCAEGEAGEIEIRGGTLASAYFEDERPLLDAEGYYRTGDVGFLDGGELFIAGRTGERIKLNAQSFFASDFEHALLALPLAKPGRVAVIQSGNDVVGLIEIPSSTAKDLIDEMRAKATELVHEATGVKMARENVRFVKHNQLERTSSGKMRRRAIGAAFEEGRLKLVDSDIESPSSTRDPRD